MIIYDISQDITKCDIFPGDPEPKIIRLQSIGHRSEYNNSAVSMCLHTGTHIDAPLHYFDEGKGISELNLIPFVGDCYIVNANENITGDFIEERITPKMKRVLFRTNGDYYLDRSGANALADTNVMLVGIDSLSISHGSDELPAHVILLRSNIYILEGLNLKGVPNRKLFLSALPINTGKTDGAPCRAVLIEEDDTVEPLPVFNNRNRI